MKTYKTTAKEIFTLISPAMAELRTKRVKGAVALSVARNVQTVRFATEPIEAVRQRIQDEMQVLRADKDLKPADLEKKIGELGREFDEVLAQPLELSYLPLPYADMQSVLDECPLSVTDGIMFMLVVEPDDSKKEQ